MPLQEFKNTYILVLKPLEFKNIHTKAVAHGGTKAYSTPKKDCRYWAYNIAF
jgi:hypothetical protein